MTWKVLALSPLPPEALGAFVPDGAELVPLTERTPDGLRAALAEAEIVVGDWSYQLKMDADAIDAAPHLALVQHPSVGYDSTDLEVATANGVAVANTPGANARSVAEWCVLTALALRRRLPRNQQQMADGEWPQGALGAREINGAKVGILGMGAIGTLAAELFTAFGADVSYWSRTRKDLPYRFAATPRELAKDSDLLISLLPGGPQTRHLIDAELLRQMPAGAYLISAGRGSVVDEQALVKALQDKAIAGAGLDVFEVEPLPKDSPALDDPGGVHHLAQRRRLPRGGARDHDHGPRQRRPRGGGRAAAARRQRRPDPRPEALT